MNHTNSYKDNKLIIIVNKKLKNSYISLDKEKSIIVKTPFKSEIYIQKLLEEKSYWIEKQLVKLEKIQLIATEPLYTIDFLKDKIAYFSQEMHLDFSELKIKKMKSRWGSCNSNGTITLNSELTKLKEELIEYVVVHELSHLVHMNHSREFHALVEHFLPNSKRYRQELKKIRLT